MKQSALELLFQAHLDTVGCPKMERQYKFHPARKWRLDFARLDAKTAVEIDGGEFMRKAGIRGGHNRGAQMAKDYEKRNQAIILGWAVFQLTGQMVEKEGMMWARNVKWMIEERRKEWHNKK